MYFNEKLDDAVAVENKPKTLPQIFREAAEIVKTRGWCQNTFEASDGSVCTYTALSIAATGEAKAYIAGSPAWMVLVDEIGPDICTWNNKAFRTKEDVIAAFERCAQKIGV